MNSISNKFRRKTKESKKSKIYDCIMTSFPFLGFTSVMIRAMYSYNWLKYENHNLYAHPLSAYSANGLFLVFL